MLITLVLIFLSCNWFYLPQGLAYSLWGTSSQGSDSSFWQRLRNSFVLRHYAYYQPVNQQIHWFQSHPEYLKKILNNAKPYLFYIFSEAKKHKLPGEIVLMPFIESAYDPFAYSRRGAAGLWQLMPATAIGYGLKQDWWYDGRRDVFTSTPAALKYVRYLGDSFRNNWLYAIAAYDAGEGTLHEAMYANAKRGKSTAFWNLSLPHETQKYVARLLALAAIIKNPSYYGIQLPRIKDQPYFAPVDLKSQIDLNRAAKLADISLRELYQLNPGFNRWATDPNGPYRLLLPIAKIDSFKANLMQVPKQKRISWQRYRVKPGDSLAKIAHRYQTSIALMQQVNKLSKPIIHINQILLIPIHTKNLIHYDLTPELDYAKNQQLNLGPSKLMVTVKKNASIWQIAQKYHLKETQIQSWNHLNPSKTLRQGQKLKLYIPTKTHIPNSVAIKE